MERVSLPSDLDTKDRIKQWRKEATFSHADDTVSDLFASCHAMILVLRDHLLVTQSSYPDTNSLQRSHDTLQIWADRHGLYNGAFEVTLEKSASIRESILELLVPLCKVLSRSPVPRQTNYDQAKKLYDSAIRQYRHFMWRINSEDHVASDSGTESETSDSDANAVSRPMAIRTTVRKVAMYTECLLEISISLDCIAVDDTDEEDQTSPEIAQRSAEDYHTERLRAKFPKAESKLLQALGKTSWERYQRMQQEREKNEREQNIVTSDGKSVMHSEFQDSGLGTSLPTGASSYAATHMSLMTSLAGGKRLPIPALSDEAEAGGQFECIACNRLIRVSNEREWRKHLYLDLQTYTCCFTGCAFSAQPFLGRSLWAEHIETEHGLGPNWTSVQCPLCLNATRTGQRAILGHFSEHMEDIALTSLPRDIESEAESESDTDSDREYDPTRRSPVRSRSATKSRILSAASPVPEIYSLTEIVERQIQEAQTRAQTPSKTVSFELLEPHLPQSRARLPMRVNIFPHDSTESIISTVKNFYGLHDSKGVIFEDRHGKILIARYEDFDHGMVVYVRAPLGLDSSPISSPVFDTVPQDRMSLHQDARYSSRSPPQAETLYPPSPAAASKGSLTPPQP